MKHQHPQHRPLQNTVLASHNIVTGKCPVVIDYSTKVGVSRWLTQDIMADKELRKRIEEFFKAIGVAKVRLTPEDQNSHRRQVDPELSVVAKHVTLTIDWYVIGVSMVLSVARSEDRDKKFSNAEEIMALYTAWKTPPAPAPAQPAKVLTFLTKAAAPPPPPAADPVTPVCVPDCSGKRVGVRDRGRLLLVGDLLSDVSTFDEVRTATGIVYGTDSAASQVTRFLIAEGLIMKTEKGKYRKVSAKSATEPPAKLAEPPKPTDPAPQPVVELPAKPAPETQHAALDLIKQKLTRLDWLREAEAVKKHRVMELEGAVRAVSGELFEIQRELEALSVVEQAWKTLQEAARA